MFLQEKLPYFRGFLYWRMMIIDMFSDEELESCLLESIGNRFSKLWEMPNPFRKCMNKMFFTEKVSFSRILWFCSHEEPERVDRFQRIENRVCSKSEKSHFALLAWSKKWEKTRFFIKNINFETELFQKLADFLEKLFNQNVSKILGVPFSLPFVSKCCVRRFQIVALIPGSGGGFWNV